MFIELCDKYPSKKNIFRLNLRYHFEKFYKRPFISAKKFETDAKAWKMCVGTLQSDRSSPKVNKM